MAREINAIIIDDENHSIQTLKYELELHCPFVNILTTCNSARGGIEAIHRWSPDLVFLDIEMPGMNGLDMLRQFQSINFKVIFVTAYDRYALEAFRFAAVDYLLKPIISEHLIESLKRTITSMISPVEQTQLDTLLYNLQHAGGKSQKIAFTSSTGIDFVQVRDIIECRSESNYSHIIRSSGSKITLAKTLKELEEMLSEYGFFRCHQSHLVNADFVNRLVKRDGFYLVLKNGSKVPVSKRKREACVKFLEMY